MSNIVNAFEFQSQEIRFVGDKPVANDVAKALGYADPAKTVSTKVFPENRSVTKMVTVDGKLRDVTVLEEAGIYQLVFSSKLESAVEFQQWVFSEVLPSIRKTGSYAIDSDSPKTYGEALLEAGRLQLEKERLEAEMLILNEQNQHLAEAVDELFDYSSIIRIAKYNNVPETKFKWQVLKGMSRKMGIEVKRVPCPRFEYKLLYSHDVWRVCYPDMIMPETTTLMLPTR